MSKRKKQRKKYSDHYGKNKPLQSFQGRCRNNSCSIAVFDKTLIENDGLCPFCAEALRVINLGREEQKKEEEEDKGTKKKRKGKVEKAGEIFSRLTEEERKLLLDHIQEEGGKE